MEHGASPNSPLSAALRACKRHFLYAAIFSALSNLLFIVPMLYMLQVYDRVVPTQGRLTLFFLTLILVVGLVALSLLDYVRSRLLVRAGVRLDQKVSAAVIDATLGGAGEGSHTVAKQSLREFDTFRQTLTGPAVLALFDSPWTPVYVLIGWLIHPYIGLLTAGGAVLLTLLAWRNDKATRERLERANEAAGRAYTSHGFTAAAADVVKALGMRRALVGQHLQERVQMMTLQTEASFASSGWVAVSKFLRLVLQSLALGIGALLAIDNQISAGAIFAATFLVGRALAPIDQLIGAWRSIIRSWEAYRNLGDLFEKSGVGADALTHLPAPEGSLKVERLTFFNASKEAAILQNVSFSVGAGEVIGIIGPSGAGKSTLVRVIAGAATADDGCVRFDGARQGDWDPERLARHIGYMPQEASLFAGSVRDNISRFRSNLSEDKAAIDAATVEAAQAAGAHDLILRLPSGYDHQLGLGGRGLSAGQAQRIALARAVYGTPRYLVLDEPNSHLDSEGDLQLISTLDALKKKGTTILIVAHKLTILPVVDRLLMLRDGQVEMYGLRDEILARIKAPRAPQAVPRSAS